MDRRKINIEELVVFGCFIVGASFLISGLFYYITNKVIVNQVVWLLYATVGILFCVIAFIVLRLSKTHR